MSADEDDRPETDEPGREQARGGSGEPPVPDSETAAGGAGRPATRSPPRARAEREPPRARLTRASSRPPPSRSPRCTRRACPTTSATRSSRSSSRYPQKRSASIPSLFAIQRRYGWCTPEGIRQVAAVMGVTAAYLESVASFYDLFHLEPAGRHRVLVCTNISCWMRGGDELLESFCGEAGVDAHDAGHGGAVSDDGELYVSGFECLGACDLAPMASIDERYYGPLELEDARRGGHRPPLRRRGPPRSRHGHPPAGRRPRGRAGPPSDPRRLTRRHSPHLRAPFGAFVVPHVRSRRAKSSRWRTWVASTTPRGVQATHVGIEGSSTAELPDWPGDRAASSAATNSSAWA